DVAETIAKALRDLGAEVECKESRAVTPVAGSLPPTASKPPTKPKRRMRATAVAGSFRPGDLSSSVPPAPEPVSEAVKEPSLPPPSAGIPELSLDFEGASSKRSSLKPRGRRRRSSGSPARSHPPPAHALDALALDLDASDDGTPVPPSDPPAALEVDDVPLPGDTSPEDVAAVPPSALGAFELSDVPVAHRAETTATSPPVTTSRPPDRVDTSVAAAVERRDVLVAGALLGAVVVGIGYRFSTYVERPEPTAESAEQDSVEQRVLVGELVDARAYIDGGGEIVTASRSRLSLRALVEELYEVGARKVYAEAETPARNLKRGGLLVAVAVVVHLPADDDALDPIVAQYAAWSGRLANTITLDELESHGLGPGYWRMRVDLEAR
ncbi:MAG: hypothetical protein RIF41_10360, partial [Polyangiaceae bacterium]